MLEYHHFSVNIGLAERLHMIVRERSYIDAHKRLIADDPIWTKGRRNARYEGRAEGTLEGIAMPSDERGRVGEPCFYHSWVA